MSWTIRKKLLAAFTAGALLTLSLGGFSLYKMSAIYADTAEIGTNWLPSTQYIGRMTADLNRLRVFDIRSVATADKVERLKIEDLFKQNLQNYGSPDQKFVQLLTYDDEKRLYAAASDGFKEYPREHEKLISLLDQGASIKARQPFITSSLPLYEKTLKAHNDLMDIEVKYGTEIVGRSEGDYDSTHWLTLIAVVIIVVASLSLGLWLANAVSRPVVAVANATDQLANQQLPQLAKAAPAIAGGDPTHDIQLQVAPIPVTTSDEIGRMTTSFNLMTESLGEIARSFQQMIANLREMAGVADKIAVGDLSAQVEPKSARDSFGNSFQSLYRQSDALTGIVNKFKIGDHNGTAAVAQLSSSTGNYPAARSVNGLDQMVH